MPKKKSLIIIFILLILVVIGVSYWLFLSKSKTANTNTNNDGSTVQIANPASVNCLQVGGQLMIQKRGDGGEYGLCYFEDNRACEEWALLRGDCPLGGIKTTGFETIDQKYCAWSGGQTFAVPNSVCTFKNGSTCPTATFYSGECQPAVSNPATGQNNDIRVISPQSGATVKSPLSISGEAKGTWFFEASFPIQLVDARGQVVAQTQATAKSDWMTENFVPFTAELNFTTATTGPGEIIFKKDNPSGLPQNDAEIRIPVIMEAAAVRERAIKLFYYSPAKDSDSTGNIGCTEKGLVSVERKIPLTNTPVQDAVRLLLKGDLTSAERAQGITTEYPLAGLTLTGASSANGTLTLSFADPNNQTGGGSCRVGILWMQIAATAKQFDGVGAVKFAPEELFQP